jgi:hypothetical protein
MYCIDFIQVIEIAMLTRLADSIGVVVDLMLKWPKVTMTPTADAAKVGRPRRERDNGCGHCRFLDVSTGGTGPAETHVVFFY